MNVTKNNFAFILGCERSGSTWLSNIIDAHSEVEFFMEPFADYAYIFPDVPNRNIYLSDSNNKLINLIHDGYNKLFSMKYPLAYKGSNNVYLSAIDQALIKGYLFFCKAIRTRPLIEVERYSLLNLNTSTIPVSQKPVKLAIKKLVVTKELRLNFKLGLINKAFENAKYIIIVRHPGAEISSIMRLFENGNLGELRRSLYSFLDVIYKTDRFKKYHKFKAIIDSNSDIVDILLLWWLINYEVLIDDCKRFKLKYRIVYHEKLSKAPIEEIKGLLSFLGINFIPSINNYINKTTKSKNHKVKSAVDVVRDSANDCQAAIENVNPLITSKIECLFSQINLIDELIVYGSN